MFSKNDTIEELIIGHLNQGAKPVVDIVQYFHAKKSFSKQGVYKALKKLREEEIITVSNKEASLSSIWIRKMADFFSLAEYHYKQSLIAPNFLSLAGNQKISISLKTLKELDIFSAHIFYLATQVTPKNQPVLVYNHHQWFYYGRKDNDEFLAYKASTTHPVFLLLGDDSPLDIAVKKRYHSNTLQTHCLNRAPFPMRYYVNSIGDFLIEYRLDKKVAEMLDAFFKRHADFNEAAREELKRIITQPAKHTVTISKNEKKNIELKKIFKKYFHISQTP